MKREEHDVLHYAEERYIEEADPAKMVSGKRSRRGVYIALAACLALLLVVGGVIALPMLGDKGGDGGEYQDSPYAALIGKLADLKKENDRYYTEGLMGELTGDVPDDGMPDMEPNPMDPAEGVDSYVEVTDNQVSGVTEGDLFKRSDRYIYYLDGDTLYVYTIDGEKSEKAGSYHLPSESGYVGKNENVRQGESELFLSKDCKTVTVLLSLWNSSNREERVQILSLDVSDPADIVCVGGVSLTGVYASARCIDGKFLVMTSYSLSLQKVDFNQPDTFVPAITRGQDVELIAPEQVFCPDKAVNTHYTVLTLFEEGSLETVDASALLSYNDDPYITAERIFAYRTFTHSEDQGNLVKNKQMTEILALSYTEKGFSELGGITLEGYLKDRYSLDEHNGILRAVTTVQNYSYKKFDDTVDVQIDDAYLENAGGSHVSASLYCIDLEKMKIAAEVKDFSPEGETVQSVRFEGTNAYVCTAIVFTDPVFFFDLSDLEAITYKETPPIEGYSSSLVTFGKGNLLGIGKSNGWDTLKVEIYREGENAVESVSIFELKSAYASEDYKAYYIDRANGLVGLGYQDNDSGNSRYLVLHFDGIALKEVANVELNGSAVYQRGVYIDGYYYFLGDDDFQVHPLVLE